MGCSETVYMIFREHALAAARARPAARSGASQDAAPSTRGARSRADRAPAGALHVRMASLCSGYRVTPLANGDAAARPPKSFDDGWCITGDEYRIDDDGFYHHCGRSDDMLRVAGNWVSPAEIEDALSAVAESTGGAAVAG